MLKTNSPVNLWKRKETTNFCILARKKDKDLTQTYLFTDEKASGAIPFFPVEDGSFGNINNICYCGREESHKGTQYPTLRAIEERQYTASNIRPASQFFDSMGICNTVLHPVRRRELIIPDSVVPEERSFRFPHRIMRCQRGNQSLAPRTSTAVVPCAPKASYNTIYQLNES